MPDIVFDGRKISVPAGMNLVDAGAKAGVSVPIFCYHQDLGAVGACRVCAVTIQHGGKSRLAMGCMTEALDGMEVTTLDPASRELRRWVLEWLMVNHPHDCPICDEGGECQLQDLTIAAGHGVRRTHLKKRTFANQFLGEFISHEMNRCITCYRCSRFYQEYAGGRDFGVTGSRGRVYFGRFEDGPLESPFSGNLVEMCPTGVFTDKLFRYKSRVWDLEIAPSICPHCSVGCNVQPGSRHRELQRVRMRENRAVNGPFLCDRGQFGHGYVMDAARPRTLRVHGQGSDWDAAIAVTSGTLLEIARTRGAERIAFVASPRASLETHFAMESLATGSLQGVQVSHFDDADREARALACLQALVAVGAEPLEQSDIAHCDVLVVAGASLVDEAPLTALAARQCARRGGRVFVLSPVEHYLGDVATVAPTSPAAMADRLTRIRGALGKEAPSENGPDASVAAALHQAKRPGLLLGSDLLDGAALAAGAELARALKGVRFGTLFPGPNGFGAAAMSKGATLPGILSALENGELEALVTVETDLSAWSPRARQALERVPLVIALDYLAGPLADDAHVFFPTTTTYESNGTYVNRAGRMQGFAASRSPGLSIIQEISNGSFPRTPRRQPLEGEARMAWWILEALRAHAAAKPPLRSFADLRDGLERSHAAWRSLRDVVAGNEGVPLRLADVTPAQATIPALEPASGLAVFRLDRTLGSEVLSRRSAPMRTMAGPPRALLSVRDAERLGIRDRIAIDAGGSAVELAAVASPGVAEGVVIVPAEVEWPLIPRQGATVRVVAAQTEAVAR